jgi:hypothetical protein
MRRTHRNVLVTAAILAALCLPAAAPAIEGAGAHKGSFLLFPYYDNRGGNLTFFRISMATEPGDPNPGGTIELHMVYLEASRGVDDINAPVAPCRESNRYMPFTLNDYMLLNVAQSGSFLYGWAYATAVLDRPGGVPFKLLWDRFFSDTILVDTSLGAAASWNNVQQWGNANTAQVVVDGDGDGVCDYGRDQQHDQPAPGNEVCSLGADTGRANMGVNAEYWPAVFPDTFSIHYFTEAKRPAPGAPGMEPTLLAITVVEHTGGTNYSFPPGPTVMEGEFQWDALVMDAHERVYSLSPSWLHCFQTLSIHELTRDTTRFLRLPEGFVKVWEVDTFGGVSEDALILTLDSWRGMGGMAWASYATHERTSVDDLTPFNAGIGDDFDPEAP